MGEEHKSMWAYVDDTSITSGHPQRHVGLGHLMAMKRKLMSLLASLNISCICMIA